MLDHLDSSFQCNMIFFTIPFLLCITYKLTFVATFKLKTEELWLVKSDNNQYLLNVNSTPSQVDTWFLLTKQNNIGSDDILTLDEEGNLKTSSTTDDTELGTFTDANETSSVTISYNKKSNKYSIEGILNNTWTISPLETSWITQDMSNEIWSTPADCEKCLKVTLHNLNAVEEETEHGSDYELLPENMTITNIDDPSDPMSKAMPLQGTKYPEILFTVDYSLHKRLGSNEARTRQYVQRHFNSANSMYASLSNPRVKLQLAGIIVGTSPTSLPFLHRGGSYSSRVEASSALSGMGRFYNRRSGLPRHDIVIALTSQDMQIRGNSGTIGLAYVGGACTNGYGNTRSVAIVEDGGRNSAASTTAHELGHLFGSVHDGDRGAQSCSGGFFGFGGSLMSPFANGSRRWSKCSVRQLSSFLNSRRANCLNNAPRGGGVVSTPTHTTPSRPNILDIISNVINDIFRF